MSSFLTMVTSQRMIYVKLHKYSSFKQKTLASRLEVELDLCKCELGDTKSFDAVVL